MRYVIASRNVIALWFEWHFIDAMLFLLKAWKNILFFNLRFFSVFFLLKTLFAHWHRYKWRHSGGFNLSGYLEVVFSNLISRFLGAIMRVFLIFVALVIEIVIFIIGALLIIFWLILPLLTLLMFIEACKFIL